MIFRKTALALILALFIAPSAMAQHNGSEETGDHFQQMQQMMDQAGKTSDPAERHKLMQDHMDMMHKQMRSMHGMMSQEPGKKQENMQMLQNRMDMMQMMMEQMMAQQQMMMDTQAMKSGKKGKSDKQ